MRKRLLFSMFVLAAGAAGVAAQPQAKPAPPKVVKDPPPPPLVGVGKVGELRPTRGFVDDGLAIDGGKLLALVRDGAGGVALHTVTLADGSAGPPLDLTKIAPEAMRVTPLGDRLFVVYGAEPPRAGALVDATGKVLRAHKPATELAIRTIGGKPMVIAYTHDEHAKGGELHQVAVFDPATGKKVAKKGGKLLLGADHRDAKLDFRPIYFLDDMTTAVGVRGGHWVKKENQRSPDTWATYDLITGTWTGDQPISDPMALARRQPVLTAHQGERVFARIADDLSEVEVWRDGTPVTVALDQPLEIYDPLSVQYGERDGKLWISLTVDPTNAPAVKRQKADPRYLDLFEVDGDHATRRARLLVAKQGVRWGWAGDRWWVLEKSAGFSRGGVALGLYRLP